MILYIPKRTKTERTTQEQLQHYIMFCKQHPELQRGKLTPTNPQGLQILWLELADNLNALRGPTRSSAKWKESLMHWKHQLRSRARKLKTHAQATGGGPPISGMPSYIPPEKLTAAKMLRTVLKKMEDREKREEEAIALQRQIVEQNEQMTGVLTQMTQALTSLSEVMAKLSQKLDK
ncbi:uncharacterized protein LOC125776746 [Bactrocera dorsalis]|uniref:Regulatory protein zeste n=1 Tax=Bactrocera dorsalis TaxID=27457 RepID=A0ABM3JAK8_BACDO|nr:uncharacterized protein LOC125776746 [Bactrocera dorsalis]